MGKAQKSYSESDLQSFVQTYILHKKDNRRTNSIDSALLETYKITPLRYREIATSALNNDPINLNPNEQNFFQKMEDLNLILNTNKETSLIKLCLEQNISLEKYSTILNSYKTDIAFQRSLKPYFDNYIKSLK